MTIDAYAVPSGPFTVGVRDGELLDRRYPSVRADDEHGRQLMLRVWYPAAEPTQRRTYFDAVEREVIAGGWSRLMAASGVAWPDDAWDVLVDLRTHSHVDAPVAEGRFPVVLFSHGATGYVQQNLPLMEHLASHGYVVVSIARPCGAVGVVYRDGQTAEVDPGFLAAGADPTYASAQRDRLVDDVATRWAATERVTAPDLGLGRHLQRWVDDQRAVTDALEDGEDLGLGADLVGACDVGSLAWTGMSYGGVAATTGAQQDERVMAAVNIDGTEWLPDLLATEARMPLLSVSSDLRKLGATLGAAISAPFSNEFFYEALPSMGSRPDIVRVTLTETTHFELTDLVLLGPEARRAIPGAGGCDPATDVIRPLNDLVLGFLEHRLRGSDNAWPRAQLQANAGVQPLDVSHVSAWAR